MDLFYKIINHLTVVINQADYQANFCRSRVDMCETWGCHGQAHHSENIWWLVVVKDDRK